MHKKMQHVLLFIGCLLGMTSNAEVLPAEPHPAVANLPTHSSEDQLSKIVDLQARTILKNTVAKEAKLESVQNLRLDNAQISTVEGFGIFKDLKHLSLSGNFINNITPLNVLIQLKTLNLSKNQIVVPSVINLLKGLESLDFSYNQLKYAFCCMFVSLRHLRINNNNIQQLIYLNNFNKLLEEVDVSDNPLKSITIKAPMPSLKKLNASRTLINQVNDLTHLQSLEELNLQNCIHLQSIACLFYRVGDHWICKLNHLKRLTISQEFLDNQSKAILADIRNQQNSKLVIQ